MKLDIDLTFSKVDLSDTFANFILQTKSGFAVRAGYKTSGPNVYMEGRMVGAGYQLGGIDARAYVEEVKHVHKYSLRKGANPPQAAFDDAKKELKEIFDKYTRVSNTITNFNNAMDVLSEADELTQRRFVNIVSYLYSFLIIPDDFEKHMKFCYFSAKKITSNSGIYLILQ